MFGLFASQTETRHVFLRTLPKKTNIIFAGKKRKSRAFFSTKIKKTFCFPNNNSLWTGSFTTATYFIGLQNHNHTYRGRSTIMIPSTLTPRTNYCFHWTLVVDTGLAALKVGCFLACRAMDQRKTVWSCS